MTKLILTACAILSIATTLYASPVSDLKVSIDSKLITFPVSPILKNDVWLVPIDTLCKELGLKAETPDSGEMVVICGDGESELCVPLQLGEQAFNIDNATYAKLEDVIEPFGFEIYKISQTEFEIVRPEQLTPNFMLPDLDDNPKRLRDFRGKKTLLYIWGSW